MKRGFTLIELVAVLLLVGVLVASSVVSLIPVAEGLVQARRNATALRKSRLAFARLAREFAAITNVSMGGPHTIQYVFLDSARTPYLRSLSWSGTPGEPLTLGGIPLTDDVGDFRLRYYDRPDDSTYTSVWTTNSTLVEATLQSLETGDNLALRLSPRNVLFQEAPEE